MRAVRVGHIEFLNCYPLYHGLERRGTLSRGRLAEPKSAAAGGPGGGTGFELVPGVPTQLNRWLVEGVIDIGLVSSIAYARNHRQLLLSRHLSISSLGAVDSIQLVTAKPWEEISSVALTTQSATSVALLKTILKLRFGREVEYFDLQGSVAGTLATHDAVLLIGDQGLDALYFPQPGFACHDLGAVWQEWTGLPMVYAVMAARKDVARQNGAGLLAVEEELVRCREYGREHLAEVVEGAAGRSRLDRQALERYFAILRYDFPPAYQLGLLRFYELAHEAGELDEVPELRFIDEMAAPDGAVSNGDVAAPDRAAPHEQASGAARAGEAAS